jgi:hypothetical protein
MKKKLLEIIIVTFDTREYCCSALMHLSDKLLEDETREYVSYYRRWA